MRFAFILWLSGFLSAGLFSQDAPVPAEAPTRGTALPDKLKAVAPKLAAHYAAELAKAKAGDGLAQHEVSQLLEWGQGVPVDLPQTQAGALPGNDEPLSVTIDSEGLLWVQETQVEFDQLVPLLIAVSERNPDVRIFVRGDRTMSYGRILEVIGAINGAGFSKVALVTRPPAQGGGSN